MARWANSTLVALGGFDKNVIIDELLIGEDNYYDISFLADTQRIVNAVSGSIVTFRNGDNTVFAIGNKVSFGNVSTLYEIIAFTSTTITLNQAPIVTPVNGEQIQIPIDLSAASFEFRLLEHSADINDDSRAGVELSNITAKAGATIKNLDSNVLTTVPWQSLALGQVRVIINDNDLTDSIGLDSANPPLYLGYLGVNFPSPDVATPAQTKKQRMAFIVRSDGLYN
jgi:hypothetical protein